MTSRPSTAAPILAVLVIVLPFALYIGGYFWVLDYHEGTRTETGATVTIRTYHADWQRVMFAPVGIVEEQLSGREVMIWPSALFDH